MGLSQQAFQFSHPTLQAEQFAWLLIEGSCAVALAGRLPATDQAVREGMLAAQPGGTLLATFQLLDDFKLELRSDVSFDTTGQVGIWQAERMTQALQPVSDDTCEATCFHPEAFERARRAVPDDACVEEASALLKAVADPTRVRMLSALSATELCVHDLALVAGISESATSHQLRLLRAHRLVTARKEGRTVYYRLTDRHVTLLIENALEHARE